MPIGSHGRVGADGTPFIRSGLELTGYDFSNSDIAFVGDQHADLERIAALEPDLILTTDWQAANVDQLRAIAPTYVFASDTVVDDFQIHEKLAELMGAEVRLERLKARYEAQLAMIHTLVPDPSGITVSVFHPAQGQLQVWHTYFGLGRVLRDAGFAFPPAVDAIAGQDAATFSAEMLPELDADFIFVTYPLHAFGATPDDTAQAMAGVLPKWCDVLHACRNGQVIYLPRSVPDRPPMRHCHRLARQSSAILPGGPLPPMNARN